MILNCQNLLDRVQYVMKLDKTMMWPIFHVCCTSKTKLSYCDRLDWVQFVMKRRQDNDMTNNTSAAHSENDIELLWLIQPGAFDEKNQIG